MGVDAGDVSDGVSLDIRRRRVSASRSKGFLAVTVEDTSSRLCDVSLPEIFELCVAANGFDSRAVSVRRASTSEDASAVFTACALETAVPEALPSPNGFRVRSDAASVPLSRDRSAQTDESRNGFRAEPSTFEKGFAADVAFVVLAVEPKGFADVSVVVFVDTDDEPNGFSDDAVAECEDSLHPKGFFLLLSRDAVTLRGLVDEGGFGGEDSDVFELDESNGLREDTFDAFDPIDTLLKGFFVTGAFDTQTGSVSDCAKGFDDTFVVVETLPKGFLDGSFDDDVDSTLSKGLRVFILLFEVTFVASNGFLDSLPECVVFVADRSSAKGFPDRAKGFRSFAAPITFVDPPFSLLIAVDAKGFLLPRSSVFVLRGAKGFDMLSGNLRDE